jgi:hypothetical protein
MAEEQKPKVEGKKPRNMAIMHHKKEFIKSLVSLKMHTFDIGNAKYAAKYQWSVDWHEPRSSL